MNGRLLGFITCILLVLLGVFWRVQHQEERRLFKKLGPFLSQSAQRDYQERFLLTRIEVARRAIPILEAGVEANWTPSVAAFREQKDGLTPVFAFNLGAGQQVSDCTFKSLGSGTCRSGRYSDPQAANNPERVIDQPFEVHLDRKSPYVESTGRVPLTLGVSGAVGAMGTLILDGDRASVTDASLLIPEPIPGSRPQELPIQDFVIAHTPILRASKSWVFDVSYDMPPALAPMFDHQATLTVVKLEGIVQVDLSSYRAGYRAEGRLTVLNSVVGQASVSYYPEDFASIYAHHLSVPMPFQDLCFNLNDVLAEVDFKQQRLRVGGGMSMQTAESLTCGSRGQTMGYFTKGFINSMLDTARSTLGLPDTVDARGHLVMDFDDGVVCGDASVYGVSILHAAYLSQREQLYVWAPKAFRVDEVNMDNLLSSTVKVGANLMFADNALHRSMGWQCWPGDSGPRTDFESLLPQSP